MRVLIKEPGKPWKTAEVENTLYALQKAVGGYIETISVVARDSDEKAVMVMDEEGRLKGKEFNIVVCGVDIVGTVLICAARTGVTDRQQVPPAGIRPEQVRTPG